MIITDKFVYVHLPKTGGTFVEKVLTQIHEARGDVIRKRRDDDPPESLFRRVKRVVRSPGGTFIDMEHRQNAGFYNQHGIASKIPPEHRHKVVLGTIRNPYDRYVSQYEFKWWQAYTDRLAVDQAAIKAAYPTFPEVSFADFVALTNSFFMRRQTTRLPEADRLGRQTEQIATCYFKTPDTFMEIDAAYLTAGRFNQDFVPKLHLINMDHLNQGLHDFLLTMGYDPAEIAFILSQGKILPKRGGRTSDQTWDKYYTPELKAWVRHRERVLFELFPEFDV